MAQYELTATCLFGLEGLLGDEITALGYERTETIDGRVSFKGDADAIARSNLWLRTAERVLIKVGSFHAETFEELFEGTKALGWSEFIGPDDAFPVKGHSVRSKLFAIPSCQSIIKKALVDNLGGEYGISVFPEDGTKVQVVFFILNDEVTLLIDTTGVGLHKRGYRPAANAAPLRETLAAALVKISRPREEVLLYDPMCGSGTIPIEAALMMTNTAPGMHRSFAAEDFDSLPMDIWARAREEACDLQQLSSSFEAWGSDIDAEALDIARENVKRAGMQDHIRIFRRDVLKIVKEDRRATIVCNPPYGERLMDKKEAQALYRGMGRAFAGLSPWQIYVITSDESFPKLYGRRPDKIRRLYNGMIKCNYYQYFKNK